MNEKPRRAGAGARERSGDIMRMAYAMGAKAYAKGAKAYAMGAKA